MDIKFTKYNQIVFVNITREEAEEAKSIILCFHLFISGKTRTVEAGKM